MLWTCSEVQPNEAGALAAIVQSLTEGDASSRQERFRRIVTKGEGAAVQPGEVGRLRRGPSDLGKLGRQQLAEELAICGEPSADSVEPAVPMAESRFGRDHPEYPHAIGQRWYLSHRFTSLIRSCDHQRCLQAGQIERLRR